MSHNSIVLILRRPIHGHEGIFFLPTSPVTFLRAPLGSMNVKLIRRSFTDGDDEAAFVDKKAVAALHVLGNNSDFEWIVTALRAASRCTFLLAVRSILLTTSLGEPDTKGRQNKSERNTQLLKFVAATQDDGDVGVVHPNLLFKLYWRSLYSLRLIVLLYQNGTGTCTRHPYRGCVATRSP